MNKQLSNKLLDTLLKISFAIFATLTLAHGFYLWQNGFSKKFVVSMVFVCSLAIFAVVALKKCQKRGKARFLFALWLGFCMEFFLQVAGLFGYLTLINSFDHVPYGRVCWDKEGYANSTMNRYGWYYPEFAQQKGDKKIVLIGDSFIEGIQIAKTQNIGVHLQKKLDKTKVLSLGMSGIGPAQYLELLKYSHKYFSPQEAIIFVFLSNDFRNACLELEETKGQLHPGNYIFYKVMPDETLQLNPHSKKAQKNFIKRLEQNHQSLLLNLVNLRILKTHCMSFQVLKKMRRQFFQNKQSQKEIREREKKREIEDCVFFANPNKQEKKLAKQASNLVLGLLKKCWLFAQSKKIKLKLVTIPNFSPQFYQKFKKGNWNPKFAHYNIQQPENSLVKFAKEHQIPILPMISYLHQNKVPTQKIKPLFLTNGSGHFSAQGHKYFAYAVYQTFYQK